MNKKVLNWRILCSNQLTTLFDKTLPVTHLSEKRLVAFMKVLIAKYMLSDDETLEQFAALPSTKVKEYVAIQRTGHKSGGRMKVNLFADSGGISITVNLIEKEE